MEVGWVEEVKDVGEGVNVVGKGVWGKSEKEVLEFEMKMKKGGVRGEVVVCVGGGCMKEEGGW